MAIEKPTFYRYPRNSDKKSSSSHEIVRTIDTTTAADTSCNRRSDAPDNNQTPLFRCLFN